MLPGFMPMAGLIGARAQSLTTSYQAQSHDTVGRSTYTFSSVSLGAADSTRTIVVAVVGYTNDTGQTVSSATIGGISASIYNRGGGAVVTAFLVANVPSGTTGDVVVTWSASIDRCAYACYALTGKTITAATPLTSATGTFATAVNLSSVTTGLATTEATIACGTGNSEEVSNSCAWSNATENCDVSVGNYRSALYGYHTTSIITPGLSAASVSTTWTGSMTQLAIHGIKLS